MRCYSEAEVNDYGLIFGGGTNQAVTLCTFNLASGKCIDSNDACTSNSEISPTAASLKTIISSITSSSFEWLAATNFPKTLSGDTTEMLQSVKNTISLNNVIPSTIIPNSATSFAATAMPSTALPVSTILPIATFTLMTSSIALSSQVLFVSETASALTNPAVSVASLSTQSSGVPCLLPTSVSFSADIMSPSYSKTQIYSKSSSTYFPLLSITLWGSSVIQSSSKITPPMYADTSLLSPSSMSVSVLSPTGAPTSVTVITTSSSSTQSTISITVLTTGKLSVIMSVRATSLQTPYCNVLNTNV